MRALERSHPLVAFCYLLSVLGVTVFSRNPVVLFEAFLGAFSLAALSARLKGAGWVLLTAAVVAITNPLFVHSGDTALFFIGNAAYTLEALCYGAAFGLMLSAAVLWGICSARYMTSDKYIWLFGRILPSAGLVLSCALRFVPLFISRTGEFFALRKNEGIKGFFKAFGAAVSYSAEEAMSAADSMKSRGYASGRRTFYSPCRFTLRDGAALGFILISMAAFFVLSAFGAGSFFYYPSLSALSFGLCDIALYAFFGALCLFPSAVILAEKIRRRSVRTAL